MAHETQGAVERARERRRVLQLHPLVVHVTYSDAKVANRDIRIWHFVIENGY